LKNNISLELKLKFIFSSVGITNVEYYCAKVEDVIDEIMKKVGDSAVFAIVDPPRSGLRMFFSLIFQIINKIK